MKLEYNDNKIGCREFLIILAVIFVIILILIGYADCITAPTIWDAPGYCIVMYK